MDIFCKLRLPLALLLLLATRTSHSSASEDVTLWEIEVNGQSYGAYQVCQFVRDAHMQFALNALFFSDVSLHRTAVPAGTCPTDDFYTANGVTFHENKSNRLLVGTSTGPLPFLTYRTGEERPAAEVPRQQDVTALALNYAASGIHSPYGEDATLQLQGQLYSPFGQVLIGQIVSSATHGYDSRTDRLLYRKDFFDSRTSIFVGKGIAPLGIANYFSGFLGNTINGVMVQRRASDAHDIGLGIKPKVEGLMEQPGTVTIKQNGLVVRVVPVPAGIFVIEEPLLIPNQTVTVERRSQSGMLLGSSTSLVYGAVGLLPAKALEWDLAAGKNSNSVYSSSPGTAQANSLQADIKYGVTDQLAIAAYGAGTIGQPASAGLGFARDLSALGSVFVGVGWRQTASDVARHFVSTGYSFTRPYYSVNYQLNGPGASAISNSPLSHNWAQSLTANLTYPMGSGRFTSNFSWSNLPAVIANSPSTLFDSEMPAEGVVKSITRSLTAQYNWRLTPSVGAAIYGTLSNATSSPGTTKQIGLTLSFALGRGSATSEFSHSGSGFVARETYTQSLNTNSSVSLYAAPLDQAQAGGSYSYSGRDIAAGLGVNASNAGAAWNGNARGALVTFNGQIMPTTYINEDSALALLKIAELPNASVIPGGASSENEAIAKANAQGYFVLPNVTPYTTPDYTVFSEDQPDDIQLPKQLIDRPINKWSAAFFTPTIKHQQPGWIFINDSSGQPIHNGSFVVNTEKDKENAYAVIGDDGKAFIVDLHDLPQHFDVFLAPNFSKTCHVDDALNKRRSEDESKRILQCEK